MRLVDRGALFAPLFSIELHSSDPDRMVEFYERTLSLSFKKKSYPYTCHIARLGRIVFIISGPEGHDGAVTSEPGKCTFGLLCEGELLEGERYFLYPKRPLGRAWPKQYASRIQDPAGNYLALASSMEDVMGRVPPVSSGVELLGCIREYLLTKWEKARKAVRGWVDKLIDRYEYTLDRATILQRDLSGYTHLVASREGLYIVDQHSYRRILRGGFFGATVKDGSLYCFQSCGSGRQNRGRILKLTIQENRITKYEIVAKGLDDGCHQIDFIGDDLVVVDCYNGRLLQMTPGRPGCAAYYPLGKLGRKVAIDVYHMNSLAGRPDGSLWVLLHNHTKFPSEVVVLNRQMEAIRRFPITAGGAHNIVFTNDSLEYLIADSSGARLISAQGPIGDTEMMRPRGISLDDHLCVVGDSFFCDRPFRRYVPGRVHFFDRKTWKCVASLLLPAAPTEVRRIDGRDLSISNYLATQSRDQELSRSDVGVPAHGSASVESSVI